jgi:hypothetical protein
LIHYRDQSGLLLEAICFHLCFICALVGPAFVVNESVFGEISGSFGGENEDVFRDVPPCSTVEIDRRFVSLMMEAVRHRKRR